MSDKNEFTPSQDSTNNYDVRDNPSAISPSDKTNATSTSSTNTKKSHQDGGVEESLRSVANEHMINRSNEHKIGQDVPSTARKALLVAMMLWAEFSAGASYSVLGPLFPKLGIEKGLTVTETGVVISIIELLIFLLSPVFGNYMSRLGCKFIYSTGILVGGITSILFGFMEYSAGGALFLCICLALRIVQGIAAAAYGTAAFVILANTFPNKIATFFGVLETSSSVGVLFGPFIGSALSQLGGFKLPFIVMGGMQTLAGAVSLAMIPPQKGSPAPGSKSLLLMLRSVETFVYLLMITSMSMAISAIASTLALHLRQYNLSAIIIGLIYTIAPGTYSVSATLWGCLGDRFPSISGLTVATGYLVGGVSLWFIAPPSFMHIPGKLLWLTCVSLGINGWALATFVLITPLLFETSRKVGFTEESEANSIVSGICNSAFSLGGFIGPIVGGALVDYASFSLSTWSLGSLIILMSIVMSILTASKVCMQRYRGRMDEERKPIVQHSVNSYTYDYD